MKNKKNWFNYFLMSILLLFIIYLFIAFESSFGRYFYLLIGIGLLGTGYSFIKSGSSNVIIGVIFIVISVIPFYNAFKNNIDSLLDTNKEANGFTIENYDVTLDVGIDNKVKVTEDIKVHFYENGLHGIYRYVPKWLEYTGKDGNTIKRMSKVSNLSAYMEKYKVVDGSKPKIIIGDSEKTVSGYHTYTIKYTYDMGNDPFEGFDEFIFHAFGDYWGTPIKNPTIVINMPKPIDGNAINFFNDKYRKKSSNDYLNYDINGNTITVTLKDDSYALNGALTIDIELPDNYFIEGNGNYGWFSFIITMVVLGTTGYIIYMWSRYGKDTNKKVPTIEFYAPDNLNPAEIGYVYNRGRTNKKLTVSLIVELASKGCIKIEEIKGKSKKDSKIKITNLYPSLGLSSSNNGEESKKEMLTESKPQFVIKKLNSDKILTEKERNVYNSLFNDNSFVKVVDINNDDFIKVKDSLVNNGYIAILKDGTTFINEENNSKEDLKDLAKPFPNLDEMEKYVYDKLFEYDNIIILNEHRTIYKAFMNTDTLLKNKFNEKVYDVESQEKKIITLVFSVILLVLAMLSFFDIEDLNPKMGYLYYISFGCVIVDFVLAFVMVRKTTYGEVVSAKVKGFREFLETAEKEKLESLVNDNPNYFYDILPYTYVLNISRKWIDKFQNIKMPENNTSDMSCLNNSILFNSIANDVSFPSSSSGGSSGGGCSSCGGGCSSCGGGGSW